MLLPANGVQLGNLALVCVAFATEGGNNRLSAYTLGATHAKNKSAACFSLFLAQYSRSW